MVVAVSRARGTRGDQLVGGKEVVVGRQALRGQVGLRGCGT